MKKYARSIFAALLVVMAGSASAANAHIQPLQFGRTVMPNAAAAPDVTTPAIVGSFITMVVNAGSTPCFNCVNGGEAGTLGMGDPVAFVGTSLTNLQILWVYYNVSFTGSCNVSVTMTQGTTTLVSAAGGPFSPTPAIDTTRLAVTRKSTWHGAATITGKLVCGTLTVMNKGTVHFQ